MKLKIGSCIDCPSGTQDQSIIAGRCNTHYWKYRQSLSKRKPKQVQKADHKLTLGKWFNEQINQLPKHCENCGEYLSPYAPWSSRAYIAHIVPKRNFISVATHPLNRWFGCIDCHTNYDNWLHRDVAKMKVIPIVRERFSQFVNDINPEELRQVQSFLEDLAP